MAEVINDSGPDILVLKFADSKIPVFKESRGKDYIKYGDDNLYPEYLQYLFDKSAKHNAIINGKANYIFGKGYENGDGIINRSNESLNDVSKKCIIDIEIYGGFKLEVIWSLNGKISEIYHCDYHTIRKAKEGGFYFKESWKPDCRDEEIFIEAFNPKEPVGSQIYEYNEYRPGIRYYPLPGYIGANNFIETDIEISKYYLSAIRNGMMPSKMVQFYQGDPTDEKKSEIERRFTKKFAGAENAGRFILVFNSGKDKQVDVSDLSASELDKQFIELNKTTQQEIFSGHVVTSPMLFGIKTEGQLGGNTELQTAYTIFQNTYSKPKAEAFDKEINWLFSYSNFAAEYKLRPSDPVGIQFDVKDVINSLPKQFVFEKLGVPQDMWALENIGSDSKPAGGGQVVPGEASLVNDNIKNLTGKQKQNIDRIVRQYENPNHPMTREQAAMMLKKGYGLDDEDVIAFLGEPVQKMSFESQENEIVAMFDECGDSKNDFEILKSKRISFSETEAEEDEKIYVQEVFKTYDVTASENKIIELIRKDERVTSDVIASVIGETEAFVESKIKSLTKRGYIESSIEMIGEDEIIKRTIPKGIDITAPPVKAKINPTQIYIKYSYEGPKDNRNRPFCAKLLELNRLYSRAEIEKISQRLGYSVFDRGGGFWNQGNGVISASCRHHWKSNIVIKKGG